MKCTFRKVFDSKLCGTACSGEHVKLSTLNSTVNQYLAQHSCLKRGTDYSYANLILNRVSPEHIDIQTVENMDICEYHKKSLTVLHKSTRQKTCSYCDCCKTGQSKSRVWFEVSVHIYNTYSQHVTVGSCLCYEHKALVRSSKSILQLVKYGYLHHPNSFTIFTQ